MSDNPHQLDRMEQMLRVLVDNTPALTTDLMRKSDVLRVTLDLFSGLMHENKIGAIKAYRALTNQPLKESKDAVEAIYAWAHEYKIGGHAS